MNRLRIAGALWLVAVGFAIVMTLIFRTDPLQWVVTLAIGVAAAAVGLWLIARPSITAPIASATSVEQLNDLTEATELQLNQSSIELLNRASAY